MTNWINYHHLFYFKTVAEEGSVSKAAHKLHIGQPTLSAQLKQFEDNLGVPLFERQHKKLILTEQGQVALDYSKNIFKMGSEMYEVLHDRLKPNRLSLHLGSLDGISKKIVVHLVKRALQIENCQITLSEGNSAQLLRLLAAHEIDMVVTNFLPSGSDSKGLLSRLIAKKNISIYAASDFKTLKKNFPKSLSAQPLIVPTYDSRLRQDLDHWGKTNKLELNIITETQDVSVQTLMAINSMGLIPAAAHTVADDVRAGKLIEIGKLQGVYEELFLLTAQRKIVNPVAAELMKNFEV